MVHVPILMAHFFPYQNTTLKQYILLTRLITLLHLKYVFYAIMIFAKNIYDVIKGCCLPGHRFMQYDWIMSWWCSNLGQGLLQAYDPSLLLTSYIKTPSHCLTVFWIRPLHSPCTDPPSHTPPWDWSVLLFTPDFLSLLWSWTALHHQGLIE